MIDLKARDKRVGGRAYVHDEIRGSRDLSNSLFEMQSMAGNKGSKQSYTCPILIFFSHVEEVKEGWTDKNKEKVTLLSKSTVPRGIFAPPVSASTNASSSNARVF